MTGGLLAAALSAVLSAALVILLSGCAGGAGRSDARGSEQAGSSGGTESASASLYLQLVDGLHVTGTAVPVDPETYRLKVSGAVDRELSLSLAEVRALPAVRQEFSLDCPGFFVDHGTWTGVPLRELLERAGVRPQARRVLFTSLSLGYTSVLSLEDARKDGVLVAYEFDGRSFPPLHGFPLRLAAKGHPGSVWVKWLGEIQVLD